MDRRHQFIQEEPPDRSGRFTGPALIVHLLLLFVVAMIGLDTMFELGHADQANGIVGLVDAVSAPFLAPFAGMFGDTAVLMPAAVAAIVYLIADGVVTSLIRRANERGARQHW
jgi:hypothetical protein